MRATTRVCLGSPPLSRMFFETDCIREVNLPLNLDQNTAHLFRPEPGRLRVTAAVRARDLTVLRSWERLLANRCESGVHFCVRTAAPIRSGIQASRCSAAERGVAAFQTWRCSSPKRLWSTARTRSFDYTAFMSVVTQRVSHTPASAHVCPQHRTTHSDTNRSEREPVRGSRVGFFGFRRAERSPRDGGPRGHRPAIIKNVSSQHRRYRSPLGHVPDRREANESWRAAGSSGTKRRGGQVPPRLREFVPSRRPS
jgi:hypothetical protein